MGAVTLSELGGWPAVLRQLVAGEDLTSTQSGAALTEVLAGRASEGQIAALVIGLRMKGETVDELSGLVAAMLDASEPVELPPGMSPVDTCGTGGSAARRTAAFNVSTVAAIVVAGAGAPVCKHGGRAATATSSSADLLEALGVATDLGPRGVRRCLEEVGMAFCFAPRFHPAMRHAAPVRRDLGVPTVFNLLGPLSNPARVRRQVLGVSDPSLAEKVVGVLQARGVERALVVYGHDGLDELTVTTTSTVHQIDGDAVRTYVVDPADLGIPRHGGDVAGGDVAANVDLARRVLDGEAGAHRDVVLLNAAAGLVAAGVADDLPAGHAAATAAVDSGAAARTLTRLASVSHAVRGEIGDT
ncbi:MAG TPA: anthranilate phosphoribosyltransferase [Acidimicrobiales bacterium]|nr:anthranilate phosphoribosyltransferase [Acidimicrobiales bacterium]